MRPSVVGSGSHRAKKRILTAVIASLAVVLVVYIIYTMLNNMGYISDWTNGRVVQKADGSLEAVVEHKDASEAVRAIRRVNGGAYALPWAPLKQALASRQMKSRYLEYLLSSRSFAHRA